jgi:hypothetical protein
MRIIKLSLSLLALAAFAIPQHLLAAEGTTLRAVLITASNEKAPADPKLAPYEATLQRNVPESSFRHVAEGSTTLKRSGTTTVALGRAQRLELEPESGSGPGIRVKIDWMKGTEVVISGSFTLEPGVPVMLGRRPSGDGAVPIVLVIANPASGRGDAKK